MECHKSSQHKIFQFIQWNSYLMNTYRNGFAFATLWHYVNYSSFCKT